MTSLYKKFCKKKISTTINKKIIIALDTSSKTKALYWISEFSDRVEWFKIGLELWTNGKAFPIIEELKSQGKKIFLDVKLHDIPNTVKKASINIAKLGVDMFNVHAEGGISMMRAAKEGANDTKIIAVTTLTSKKNNYSWTEKLALKTVFAGLDGWVSSGNMAKALNQLNRDLRINKLIVTPGIRPLCVDKNDQKDTTTPTIAIKNGSNYLVIGRAVTEASEPNEALNKIIMEVNEIETIKEIK